MNSRGRQSGLSIPGMLIVMIMVGFFIMCAIRMAPPYFEYLSVKDIVARMVMEHDAETQSLGQIRRKIANIFNSNQIYELQPEEVEIFRKKGKTFIDANYEVRIPIMGRIDAVLKFDDLLYVMGNPEPVVDSTVKK